MTSYAYNAENENETTKPKFNRANFRGVNTVKKIEGGSVSSNDENSSESEQEKPKVAAARADPKSKTIRSEKVRAIKCRSGSVL